MIYVELLLSGDNILQFYFKVINTNFVTILGVQYYIINDGAYIRTTIYTTLPMALAKLRRVDLMFCNYSWSILCIFQVYNLHLYIF